MKMQKISICEADKGGAILLLPPSYLEDKVKEKVFDKSCYSEIKKDPRPDLYQDLIDLWRWGKSQGFVSSHEAREIVGITEKDNKSTSSRFKPGTTYFVPSLKIHKLPPEDLKPGCDIPVRLISCLQNGVTKRSDVFIAHKWLKELARDYSKDMLKDSTEALAWLQDIEKKVRKGGRHPTPFTFDFASLYDSLDPILVIKAVRDAIKTCRSNWSRSFADWLIDLILLSIDSGFGEFLGRFFRAVKGIATGGSISVELANITVYFVLKKVLFDDPKLMRDVVDVKRFIDDGVGVHMMSD